MRGRSRMSNVALIVGVIGSPGVGKTTLSRALARRPGTTVISPRSAIRAALATRRGLHSLYAPINELGWISDGALGLAVRIALGQAESAEMLVLENLPGDAIQVADLWQASQRWEAQAVLLHLTADLDELVRRGTQRRVCAACEKDPDAQPHEPAYRAADPAACATCGGRLSVRPDDEPDVLNHRIKRHKQYARAVLSAAESLGIQVVSLDANQGPTMVLQGALSFVEDALRSTDE